MADWPADNDDPFQSPTEMRPSRGFQAMLPGEEIVFQSPTEMRPSRGEDLREMDKKMFDGFSLLRR